MPSSTHLGRIVFLGSAFVLLVLFAGCGGSSQTKHKVTGTVTRGGQPLKIDTISGGAVEVRLYLMKGSKRPEPDEADDAQEGKPRPPGVTPPKKPGEGDFSIATTTLPDGKWEVDNVPDGKYLITVRYFPKDRFTGKPKDELKGQFNVTNSEIIREIDSTHTHLDVDLDKEKSKKAAK